MLFTYDKANKKVGRYQTTDFKTHNILERKDLEKWIEDNPDLLGEELLVITTEYDKFDKTDERLDILAIDKDGILVIVELKRDDSGKTVELQAIKYAAYCSTMTFDAIVNLYQQYLSKKGLSVNQNEARAKLMNFVNDDFEELNDRPRIILVSKEFRPEVTASVLWLRKFNLDISCVKLTPYEFDENTIAFESTILIPLPEAEAYIIQMEKKDSIEQTLTVTQEERVAFYKELIRSLKEKLPLSFPDPSPKSYYQIPTGISGLSAFHYEFAFHGRPSSSFGVELHFEKWSKELNQEALSRCERLKPQLEKEIGERVIFLKEWGTRWSRLYIERNEGKITEELKKWAVEKMVILYRLLEPELEKIANK